MTVLKVVALVGFVLGAAGIPLIILAMDLIRPWGRSPSSDKEAGAPAPAAPGPVVTTAPPGAVTTAPPGASTPVAHGTAAPAAGSSEAVPPPTKSPPA
ncbi:MAG TPA: hypothetical protein VG389_23615 [Myxococcota bacterium]|jgi:hypothetical protein|nr:hypothetical protein [Myxococcota bacterium]